MFKPMDPQLLRDLIKDVPDALAQEEAEEAKLFSNVMCPMCYQRGAKKKILPPKVVMSAEGPVVVQSPFTTGKMLPQGHACCSYCDTEFDPYTGVIIHTEASMIASSQSDPLPE